jgi:hypothetical protein
MNKIFSRGTFAFVISALVLSDGTVQGHHGIGGRYDTSKPIVLSGTVTRATFSPPHPVFFLRVDAAKPPALKLNRPDEITGPLLVRPEDAGKVREIELSPVDTFYGLRGKVRVGDRITVVALRNCLSPNELRSSWVQLSGGQVASYAQGLHRKVDGCS